REALSLYPAYSQAHYNLAVLLRKMGRREECLEQCRKFLQVDPFHPLTERVREMMREVGEGEGEGD
ncbi:MAG: tetratricopeptide repeat protein, partial [Deltaproteobacteria bacterium]